MSSREMVPLYRARVITMWIILHTSNSKSPICVNTDNITAIGKGVSGGAWVAKNDGKGVDVNESYTDLECILQAKTIAQLLKEIDNGKSSGNGSGTESMGPR